jgi:hypothetical protein
MKYEIVNSIAYAKCDPIEVEQFNPSATRI